MIRLSGDVADATVGRGEGSEPSHGGCGVLAISGMAARWRSSSVEGLVSPGGGGEPHGTEVLLCLSANSIVLRFVVQF